MPVAMPKVAATILLTSAEQATAFHVPGAGPPEFVKRYIGPSWWSVKWATTTSLLPSAEQAADVQSVELRFNRA
jgi:hypothetical protein